MTFSSSPPRSSPRPRPGADEPARRNLRAARFTVGTSVGAGARPGTLSLRLSVTPEPVQPPIVQLQEAGAPRPRLVTVTRDPGGGYSGAIEDLAPDPNATLLVWVIGAEGQVETHLGGFRVRAVGTRALDPLHSGSGELSLYLAEPEKLGATTRVLVSTSEAVVPSLPPGTRVVSGPVSLVNLDQPPGAAPADLKALLVMRLPAGGAARPDEHGIWWLDPASGRWQAIPRRHRQEAPARERGRPPPRHLPARLHARREDPMTGRPVAAALLALLASGCGTVIRVTNGGLPVPGAEVYADGKPVGQTGSDGTVTVAGLTTATALSARSLIHEKPSYRQSHGPENNGAGWITRSYITSIAVENSGQLAPPQRVTAAGQMQEIQVSGQNALIGLHLVVSVQWDATPAELSALGVVLTQANQFLYNATDGQFFLEQIDIADDSTWWHDAEVLASVDANVWPHTDGSGGYLERYLGLVQTGIFISPRRTDGNAQGFVYIHEFGHLGFGLGDEYIGFDTSRALTQCGVSGNYCSVWSECATGSAFAQNQPQASCVMNNESVLAKFCSSHPDNPHKTLTMQGAHSCWHDIARIYTDKGNRWNIREPVTRNAIPGALPPIPAQWAPRIQITNTNDVNLCPGNPMTMTFWMGNGPAQRTPIVVQLADGRAFAQGLTDDNGQLAIHRCPRRRQDRRPDGDLERRPGLRALAGRDHRPRSLPGQDRRPAALLSQAQAARLRRWRALTSRGDSRRRRGMLGP